jgi:sterol desaturase/sphingolipid hydroxylase (fatty acid hydroxylase superfamily)
MAPAFIRLRRLASKPDGIALKEKSPMLRTILIVLVVLLLLGALPTWPYSAGWGYYPSGGLGLILIILVVLILADRL